jgi:putative hydrolase of HD superfamily
MLSIHDLVEINAGDTFLFDEERMKGKFEREKIAAKKIFGILDEPLQSEFYNLWIEFEEEETPDAIFACAIDRLCLLFLILYQGKSWTEAGVTENRCEICWKMQLRASDEMGEAFDILLQKSIDEGMLKN